LVRIGPSPNAAAEDARNYRAGYGRRAIAGFADFPYRLDLNQ
jgi:hypothetical protein